jgi:hypothetical protein
MNAVLGLAVLAGSLLAGIVIGAVQGLVCPPVPPPPGRKEAKQ